METLFFRAHSSTTAVRTVAAAAAAAAAKQPAVQLYPHTHANRRRYYSMRDGVIPGVAEYGDDRVEEEKGQKTRNIQMGRGGEGGGGGREGGRGGGPRLHEETQVHR